MCGKVTLLTLKLETCLLGCVCFIYLCIYLFETALIRISKSEKSVTRWRW